MVRDSAGREWVSCRQCDGDEGWHLPDGEWHVCGMCDGDGGYWKEVSAENIPAEGKSEGTK